MFLIIDIFYSYLQLSKPSIYNISLFDKKFRYSQS